jgi:hypothetical protein
MGDEANDKRAIHIDAGGSQPVGPGQPEAASFDPSVMDFGHYAGRTIAELAIEDPDYLQWLARHPSGARYRSEIARVLGRLPVLPEH